MALPRWNDSLSLGNALIDREHRELLELLLTWEGMVTQEAEIPADAAVRWMETLQRHVSEHFVHEEALMATLTSLSAEDRQQHILDHRSWTVQIGEIGQRLAQSRTDLERRAFVAKLLLAGQAFWREHVLTFDMNLKRDGLAN